MIRVNLGDYKDEELRDTLETINSRGGAILRRMVNEERDRNIAALLNNNDNGDRNRGRIDICESLNQLERVLKAELIARQKEAERKNEK